MSLFIDTIMEYIDGALEEHCDSTEEIRDAVEDLRHRLGLRLVPRKAFYVDEAFMTPDGIVPAYVTEGEPGYGLMLGNGPYSQPWYWGTDIETARKVCDKANADLGLTPEEARAIVDSSIAAQNRQERLTQEFQERWNNVKEGKV